MKDANRGTSTTHPRSGAVLGYCFSTFLLPCYDATVAVCTRAYKKWKYSLHGPDHAVPTCRVGKERLEGPKTGLQFQVPLKLGPALASGMLKGVRICIV